MKLELIIQSEIRKKNTNTVCVCVCVWNFERWWWQPYMQDSKRDTDIKNRLLDSMGGGKGGMIWENNIETCILPYVK